MNVVKKDLTVEPFNDQKIVDAVNKSASRVMVELTNDDYKRIIDLVWDELIADDIDENTTCTVEELHNAVESALDEFNPKIAKSYKDYRNYKKEFVHMMDDVFTKSQAIRYIGDKSNANTDSALVATKRSLIFNELNKNLYRKFFMTRDELQACKNGYIYIHDQSARLDTINCCLFRVGEVMKGGFEMGNVWYNEPNSLDTAFDVMGDIILSTAAQQYGGFTVPEVDKILEPYAEKSYDKYLRGEDGAFMEEVDVAGNVVKHYDSVQPVPGKNLKLTIDYELQKELETFTDKHLAFLRSSGIAPGARAAAVVAIDPRNGAVRAMVSRPVYDPNWFVHGISSKNWNSINNDPNYPMNNKVISGEYPPGSTFKIVTGSAAFELKKVGLNEPIFDGGFHPMVPTMGNAGGEVLGWLTFIKALAMSDNVYFYELGYRVGIDNIEKYAHIFGFGERTGIDLEGESKGLVASKKVKREIWDEDWRLGDTFNAAIGQGFNLTTPIQLSVMLSIVANGGTKYQPYLVDSIINSDGSLFEKPKRAEGKHIDVSQQTIDYIRMGMSATTQEGGTASYFAGLPKPIAGKTGTAENSHGRDHGLFVAYGPVDDPELVVVCIVEQGGFGSVAAGPIVYKAFEEFFQEKGYMPRPDKAAPKKDTIQ